VDGAEHFRAIAQGYSGVAAPFEFPGLGEFLLCFNDPLAPLPDDALDICIRSTKLISKLSCGRRELFAQLSSASFFDPLIQTDNYTIVVTDQSGALLTANSSGKKLLSGFDQQPYGSCSIAEYLKNKRDLEHLTNSEDNSILEEPLHFKGAGRNKNYTMKLQRRSFIKLPTGSTHCVLIFDKPEELAAKETPTQEKAAVSQTHCIGTSPQWSRVMETIASVAAHNSNVIIMGETGTGKEVAARELHRLSGRTGEFVAINCGALPRELLASELFGYEGGAFTGARAGGAKGKFEFANGGTLFLDEIGDMPIDMQVSLLRVLQENCVVRVGSNKPIPIDVRVVAATNQNLQKLISQGKFRSDLWYRLSVIEINLPRLAERDGDIPLLAEHFNASLSRSLNMPYTPLSQEVLDFLESYDWPGNVRELKNVMEKALIISGGKIQVSSFPDSMRRNSFVVESKPSISPVYTPPTPAPTPGKDNSNTLSFAEIRSQRERDRIQRVLQEEGGNISRSAKRLNISRNTLYRKMEKYDIHIKILAVSEK
jgi:transcriptional regulator with PAS, ATPase and Fis domain